MILNHVLSLLIGVMRSEGNTQASSAVITAAALHSSMSARVLPTALLDGTNCR